MRKRSGEQEFRTHLPKSDDEKTAACNTNRSYYYPTKISRDRSKVDCERCLKLIDYRENHAIKALFDALGKQAPRTLQEDVLPVSQLAKE